MEKDNEGLNCLHVSSIYANVKCMKMILENITLKEAIATDKEKVR